MKICIFTLHPSNAGGITKKAILLSQFLADNGCQVDWYYPGCTRPIPCYIQELLESKGISHRSIPTLPHSKTFQAFDIFGRIPKRYDIYQAITGTCLDGMVFLCKRLDYFCWVGSTIHTEKKDGHNPQLGYAKRFWRKLNLVSGGVLEGFAAKHACKVFANSRPTKEALISDLHIDDNRIIIAYPPVDTGFYSYAPYRSPARDLGKILFVGVPSTRKNIPLLFEATKVVASTMKDVSLVIVGDRNESAYISYLKGLAKELGIAHIVSFLGDVSETELRSLYHTSSFLVLPSKQEGFGMVLAEALSCGTPVIATDCGGTVDIIKNGTTGYLVQNEEHRELAGAMTRIMSDPVAAEEMGRAGRERIEQEFSLGRTGEVILAAYRDQLAK